jgi:hypothetical protein
MLPTEHVGLRWACGVILLLALAEGCGRPGVEKPPLYPVSGRVTVNGKPAAGISLNLHPVNSQSGALPAATSGPDGSFEVGTFAPGDGAPEGDYVVTATWLQSVDPGGDAPEVDRLGGRFVNPARSSMKVHVSAGPNTLPPFQFP